MKNLLILVAVTGTLFAATNTVRAQASDLKKIDPDALKKFQLKIGGLQIDQDLLKGLMEQFGGKDGKFDAEQLLKMLDRLGGSKFDSAQLKKLLEQFKSGQIDIDQIKKLVDSFGGPGGLGGEPKLPKKLFGINAEATFKKLDTNGDGRLSRKEFLKIVDSMGEDRAEKLRPVAERLFDRADPEGEGLSLEQFRVMSGQKSKAKTRDGG